jgi:glycosyltransferase involved in cell wall biosynthesis
LLETYIYLLCKIVIFDENIHLNPFLSICIPAYNQPDLILRCLNSIKSQDYTSYEVIITDDSADDSVSNVIKSFQDKINVKYYKNDFSLGSPKNWNRAIEFASGDLILVLHHDDWLINNDSLSCFIEPFILDPNIDFVFSKIDFIENRFFKKIYRQLCQNQINEPLLLIQDNFVGPPSNVMFKSNLNQFFNEDYIWLVDIEFYLRLLSDHKIFFYINKNLIDTGRHEAQITQKLIGKHHIKFLEYNNILKKYFRKKHVPFRLYDFYWRILRNGGEDLYKKIVLEKDPTFNLNTLSNFHINCQMHIPKLLLHNKVFSRLAILVTYIFYKLLS